MDELQPSREATVLWSFDSWRCEQWHTAEIVLIRGSDIVLRRPARSADDVLATAAMWRDAIHGQAADFVMPKPSRRRVPDRRRVTRGGRRCEDRKTHDT